MFGDDTLIFGIGVDGIFALDAWQTNWASTSHPERLLPRTARWRRSTACCCLTARLSAP